MKTRNVKISLISIISIFVAILCFLTYNEINKNHILYKNITKIDQLNLYEEIVDKELKLLDKKSFNKFLEENPNRLFTIGCTAKTITSTTILLFSLDKNNDYLFHGKELEITIGELLYNRQKYLKSLNNPTKIQKNKLNFINELIKFTDKRIMDTKVYKVLNHTSVFKDDFNEYLLYSAAQKALSFFPKETQDKLMFFGIQAFSLYIDDGRQVNEKAKYSNMGFMYIIGIMSLMTDKNDFYEEVEYRIFKPLGLETKFTRGDRVTKEKLKELFPNSNHVRIVDFKITKKIFRTNIYDLNYTEMDALNGGLITDLNSANIVLTEIVKLFLGMENKISNNKKISDLFFKYRAERQFEREFYSLGTTMEFFKKSFKIMPKGDVFGTSISSEFFVPTKDKKDIPEDLKHFKYNKSDFDLNDIENIININIINVFLHNIFFNFGLDNFKKEYKEILLKSLLDISEGDYDKILYELNFNSKNFIKTLKKQTMKNIKYYYRKDKNAKKEALEFFENYFKYL